MVPRRKLMLATAPRFSPFPTYACPWLEAIEPSCHDGSIISGGRNANCRPSVIHEGVGSAKGRLAGAVPFALPSGTRAIAAAQAHDRSSGGSLVANHVPWRGPPDHG